MKEAEIANQFIRAAEIERSQKVHVGPAQLRSMPLPYVHDFADKAGWRKEPGDKLHKGDDPLTQERLEFWERMGLMPTAAEITELEGLYDLLMVVKKDEERRALLAWARAKAGGKAFRRWCFKVEGIHPETGRKRKNRALSAIATKLRRPYPRATGMHSEIPSEPRLSSTPEIDDVSGTLDEDAGRRHGLNNWAADDAFRSFISDEHHDFSWAEKRNERRRRRTKKKAAQEAKALESAKPVKQNRR